MLFGMVKLIINRKGWHLMKRLFSIFTVFMTIIILSTSVCAAPRDEAAPGEMYNVIYYEEFNYDNTRGTSAVLDLLGWKALGKGSKTAINDPTANLSIVNGKLYVENNHSGGVDSYFMILNDTKMLGAWQTDYTVQFDVLLTSAADNTRYLALLTDYDESTKGYYHSFHLRINGSANNQARVNSNWTTFDAPGNYYAADQDDTDGTSSIAKKLLGKNFDGSPLLQNVSVTVRIVNEKYDIGPRVYLRNNSAGGDFVLVSRSGGVEDGDITSGAYKKTGGKAIALKAGGKINGYIDNIVVYLGCGDPVWEEIKAPETTTEPETTSAPETEAPETTAAPETDPEPEATGCASTVSASAIILSAIGAAFVMKKKK